MPVRRLARGRRAQRSEGGVLNACSRGDDVRLGAPSGRFIKATGPMRRMFMLRRRQFLLAVASTSALSTLSGAARARDYPTRPVRLVVGFPPGLSPDISARLIAPSLAARLGEQVFVDNRAGAAGNIATEFVANATPDGYTLMLIAGTNTANVTLYRNVNFDFVRDIAPIAIIGETRFIVIVNPAVPAKNVLELIAYARANPGKLNVASAGTGSTPHLVGELFMMMTGTRMVHVPYRGNFYSDLISGVVQVAFVNVASSIGYIRAGKLRALAVTSAKRAEALPEIPTVGEFVPGYEAGGGVGIGGPSKMSPEIIAILNKKINAVVSEPTIKARLSELGIEPISMTITDFRKYIASQIDKWANVIKFAGIKLE